MTRRGLGWLALCACAAVQGCDCGEVPPSGVDAGAPVYDSGALDSGVIDALGTDAAVSSDSSTPPDSAGPVDSAAGVDGTTASDAGGSDANAPEDAWSGWDAEAFDAVGNQAPSIDALPDVALLPGDSVTVTATVSDPNLPRDLLSYAWSFSAAPPAGVSLTSSHSASPSVEVDRAVYEGGPVDRDLTLRLTVTDLGGLSASATARVRILEERGPYVSNLSVYEGTGYGGTGARHGYCGARAHPCRDLADAQVNYQASGRINSPTAYPSALIVATTGVAYLRASAVTLGDGYGVECGFDPLTWIRPTDYTPTPLHFSGDLGFDVTSDARIQGCDIEGVEPDADLALRVAVRVTDATARLLDSIVVGSQRGLSHLPQQAIGVQLLHSSGSGQTHLEGNAIEGGQAVASAVGLSVQLGTPVIVGNSIVGGRAGSAVGIALAPSIVTSSTLAPARVEGNLVLGGEGGAAAAQGALGILLAAGDAVIADNPSIEGGTAAGFNAGLWVDNSQAIPEVTGNSFVGVSAAAGATLAAGAILSTGIRSSGNSYTGGHGTFAVGLLADPDLDTPTIGALALDSVDDRFSGGQGTTAVGLSLEDGASATLMHATVVGTGAGGSPLQAYGVSVADGCAIELYALSEARSGNAASLAQGLALQDGALAAAVRDSGVASGNVVLAGGSSAGIAVASGQLVLERSEVQAGNADAVSVGISLPCGPAGLTPVVHRVTDSTVRTGQAGITLGVSVRACDRLELEEVSVTAGAATGGVSAGLLAVATETLPTGGSYAAGTAVAGSSYGLAFMASGTRAHLIASDLVATAGNARDESAGIGLGDDVDGVELRGCTAQGGAAVFSGGVHVRAAAAASVVEGCDLRGGQASSLSAGLYFEQGCDGCTIARNHAAGGNVTGLGAGSRSVGARFFAEAPYDATTLVYGNRLAGGAAQDSRGVELDGRAGATLRLLNNNIAGGGRSGNAASSVGVYLGQVLLGPGTDNVGVVASNIIDPGVASSSYNIYENARCEAGGNVIAEPALVGGRNNDLYPAGATALLGNAHLVPCGIDDVTAIGRLSQAGTVNAIIPYTENVFNEDDRSWSVDPEFLADGYHLAATSFLRGRGYATALQWSLGDPMPDIDGQLRPNPGGTEADIGCDEVP